MTFDITFWTNFRAEMNNHIAKKHSKTIVRVVHYCKVCVKDFHSFYSLGALKQKKNGEHREVQEFKMLMLHN